MTLRVLIVEDEPEFLRRFSAAVLSDARLALVGAVPTGQQGIELLDRERPDVLLLDLGLPDLRGVEVIRHAAAAHPECDVLVVTMFGDDAHVVESIEAGATGYLLKDASTERVVASIHELHDGGAPISPGIARRVLARFRVALKPAAAEVGAPVEAPASPTPLTPRETELLRLTAKGLPFDEIGQLLGISSHTVVAHVKNIYRKLAVHSRSEAVYEASQLGLL
ncbi:MAG: response regulator transcription factor [Pseudomonadota bacterium]|nr:response regulator transcription factor [Pseudomonadota bacterium]